MKEVKYDFGYMFKYSERPGTYAAKKFEDNIEESIKKTRLQEIIDLQRAHSHFRTKQYLGKVVEVLIEKESKKSNNIGQEETSKILWLFFQKNHIK